MVRVFRGQKSISQNQHCRSLRHQRIQLGRHDADDVAPFIPTNLNTPGVRPSPGAAMWPTKPSLEIAKRIAIRPLLRPGTNALRRRFARDEMTTCRDGARARRGLISNSGCGFSVRASSRRLLQLSSSRTCPRFQSGDLSPHSMAPQAQFHPGPVCPR